MEGLSLVIPAHDSGKVIENSLHSYNNALSPKFRNFEMIVVCNDCRDKTAQICRDLAGKLPLRIIEIPQRGKGYALIRGFKESRFDILGFIDADNPFDLNKINQMIGFLSSYEVVIASKFLKRGSAIHDSQARRMLSLFGGVFSRIFFGLKFKDTQAGAKFFKRRVWQKIDKNFICNGFDFDMEFLYKAQKSKFKIKEFYLPPKGYDKFSTFRLKYLPGMVKRLLKLRFLK